MGGVTMPTRFDVLVATPKAFQMAQQLLPGRLAWESFEVVCFDEVHHVLKEHPYRQLALHLRQACPPLPPSPTARSDGSGRPRVLGLTASLTYAVEEKKVKDAMQRICTELMVEHMVTATTGELRASGYHATSAPAEVLPLQLPQGAAALGVLPEAERKPHEMVQGFFKRVADGSATPFALRMVKCIHAMEGALLLPSFRSPLPRLPAREWGVFARKQADAASGQQQLRQRLTCLQHWYEALRILLVSWEEAEDAAVTFLRMSGVEEGVTGCLLPGAMGAAGIWPLSVASALQREFWAAVPASYPRFDHLKEILLDKLDGSGDEEGAGGNGHTLPPSSSSSSSAAFRGILFVQQRIMTHILEHVIASEPELRRRLRPACLYATNAPATTGMSSLTNRQVSLMPPFILTLQAPSSVPLEIPRTRLHLMRRQPAPSMPPPIPTTP